MVKGGARTRLPDASAGHGFYVTGHDEVRDVIFGWPDDIGAERELMDIVEVFQIDEEGRDSEIWALQESLAQK